jgi:hypothetical protein
MSPGASWSPFAITEEAYELLVSALVSSDLKELRRRDAVRFITEEILIDETLHTERTLVSWVKRVSDNYGRK